MEIVVIGTSTFFQIAPTRVQYFTFNRDSHTLAHGEGETVYLVTIVL